MSEHDRAAGQAVPTQFVGGGAHEGDREAAAREIGAALARELAYSCAFLVMVQDLDVTKEERALADKLADALMIEHARGHELATTIETFVRSVRS